MYGESFGGRHTVQHQPHQTSLFVSSVVRNIQLAARIYLNRLGLDSIFPIAWSFGVELVVFFCFLLWFINGLENLYADQMFRITAEAKGKGLGPIKHLKPQ